MRFLEEFNKSFDATTGLIGWLLGIIIPLGILLAWFLFMVIIGILIADKSGKLDREDFNS